MSETERNNMKNNKSWNKMRLLFWKMEQDDCEFKCKISSNGNNKYQTKLYNRKKKKKT